MTSPQGTRNFTNYPNKISWRKNRFPRFRIYKIPIQGEFHQIESLPLYNIYKPLLSFYYITMHYQTSISCHHRTEIKEQALFCILTILITLGKQLFISDTV